MILKEERMVILNEEDIMKIRREVRFIAKKYDYSLLNITKLLTATSEIARNTVIHGGGGEVVVSVIQDKNILAIKLIFTDQGPGVRYKNGTNQVINGKKSGLGLGLKGTRNLMDEFSIQSNEGKGTRVSFLLRQT